MWRPCANGSPRGGQQRGTSPSPFSSVSTRTNSPTSAPPGRDGVWGITLGGSSEPRRQFTCTLDGKTIRISSGKVGRLSVDCGPQGLALTGDVKICWNALLRYEGPADEIELPWKDLDAPRK